MQQKEGGFAFVASYWSDSSWSVREELVLNEMFEKGDKKIM